MLFLMPYIFNSKNPKLWFNINVNWNLLNSLNISINLWIYEILRLETFNKIIKQNYFFDK